MESKVLDNKKKVVRCLVCYYSCAFVFSVVLHVVVNEQCVKGKSAKEGGKARRETEKDRRNSTKKAHS